MNTLYSAIIKGETVYRINIGGEMHFWSTHIDDIMKRRDEDHRCAGKHIEAVRFTKIIEQAE